MTTVYIFGAGGLGKEIAAALENDRDVRFGGFFDDNGMISSLYKELYLGNFDDLIQRSSEQVSPLQLIIAIGHPEIKKSLVKKLKGKNIGFPVFIHSKAHLEGLSNIQLGEGTVICAGAQLTTDIRIGKHVLVNLNSTIGHDCVIGDYCSIMPGANISGSVVLDEQVLVGSGTVVLQGHHIGKKAKLGAGAVITKDVPEEEIWVGVPGRGR